MKPKQLCVRLLLIFGAVTPVFAQQQYADLVRDDFFAGLKGDTARFDRALSKIDDLLQEHPKNAALICWQGAGKFAKSGTAFQKGDIRQGLSLRGQGLSEMAEAVRLAPDDAGVRVSRGAALIGASRFMQPQYGRPLLETGVGDFEAALRIQQKYLGHLSTHSKGELLMGLADGWNRLGDAASAKRYFERIASDPQLQGSVYDHKARDWLAGSPRVKSPSFFNCTGCHKGRGK